MLSRWLVVRVLAAVLAGVAPGVLGPGTTARAQDTLGEPAGADADAGAGVEIAVESFGVGGVSRPGSWVGVRLVLTDGGRAPRSVAVRLHVRDGDGDELLTERRVTLNPGLAQGVWLYARAPWALRGSAYTVSVYELGESGSDGARPIARRLGASRVSPSRIVDPEADLIGVIGRVGAGLEQYEPAWSGVASGRTGTQHELIELVLGIDPRGMPDSWPGLGAFGVLVWSGGSPTDLGSEDRPAALREWVHRGGHLVVLPGDASTGWFSSDNPLIDLMPDARARRVARADYRAYRELLTSAARGEADLPRDQSLTAFEVEPGTPPADATELLSGPDGCVVVRRLVGTGMVTVVGLEVASGPMRRPGALRADRFWHRVLGKRFETPTREEAEERERVTSGFLSAAHTSDAFIAEAISPTVAAGVGVLLAVIVFVAYWLLAGPLGYAVLRQFGRQRFAWMVFVALVGVFTAVAWTGANALREREVRARHVTFLDHVYGQPTQRSATWASVFLPRYGDTVVRLGEPGRDERWRQAISVWSSPDDETKLSFPDARAYTMNARDLSEVSIPSRATVKQLRFDWLGGRRWSTPTPIGEGWEPRLGGETGVVGRLTHDLPEALTDVMVAVCFGQREPGAIGAEGESPLYSGVRVWDLQEWAPGVELDLGALEAGQSKPGDEVFRRLVPRRQLVRALGAQSAREEARRLTFVSALEPASAGSTGENRGLVRRRESHGLDLGDWLTQPCVIIVGLVEAGPTPTPLLVGRGEDRFETIPSEGLTVLRWVYPLASRPARFGEVP